VAEEKQLEAIEEQGARMEVEAPRAKLRVGALGKVFVESGMFPTVKSFAQACVKIIAGRELGFGPVYSMNNINLIQGRIALSAQAIAAKIKRSGRYNYKIVTLTDEECIIDFYENGKKLHPSAKFSIEDAKRARIYKPDSAWEKWPRNMLFARAITQGARMHCPEVVVGEYPPEELDIRLSETGDFLVDVEMGGEVKSIPAPREEKVTFTKSDGRPDWNKFWARQKKDRNLDSKKVHELLGVESVKELHEQGHSLEEIDDMIAERLAEAKAESQIRELEEKSEGQMSLL